MVVKPKSRVEYPQATVGQPSATYQIEEVLGDGLFISFTTSKGTFGHKFSYGAAKKRFGITLPLFNPDTLHFVLPNPRHRWAGPSLCYYIVIIDKKEILFGEWEDIDQHLPKLACHIYPKT